MKNKKLTPLLIGCCILTSSFLAFAEESQLPEGKKAELTKVENIKGDTVKEELSSKNPESILNTLEVDKDGFFNDLEATYRLLLYCYNEYKKITINACLLYGTSIYDLPAF